MPFRRRGGGKKRGGGNMNAVKGRHYVTSRACHFPCIQATIWKTPTGSATRQRTRVMGEDLLDRDSRDGIEAFIAKRAPIWQPLPEAAETDPK